MSTSSGFFPGHDKRTRSKENVCERNLCEEAISQQWKPAHTNTTTGDCLECQMCGKLSGATLHFLASHVLCQIMSLPDAISPLSAGRSPQHVPVISAYSGKADLVLSHSLEVTMVDGSPLGWLISTSPLSPTGQVLS